VIRPDVPGGDGRRDSTDATAGYQRLPSGRAPVPVVAGLRRLEDDSRIDAPARGLSSIASAVVRTPGIADGLRGTWLGHALHPLLTDFPLGAWMSASLLDLVGGPEARRPAQRLVGFGLLAAVPTVAAGLAEWQETGGGARRVGVVHATVNAAALLLYGSSWLARRRRSHGLAVGLGVGGGVLATLGGYLGGHLTLVRKIGTTDPAFGTPSQ
jgi:uncharacterized membrane protein